MTSLSKIYKKSSTYQLNLQAIIPVTGYYQTTLTGTQFLKGEKPAVSTTKITDKPRVFMWWPKTTHKNTVLTLQGILEAKQVNQAQVLRLNGTKATPTKKTPVVTIVAPAVQATKQGAPPTETRPSDSESGSSDDDADPEHFDYTMLIKYLTNEVALNLEEELEEVEDEQEEEMDWAEDAEVSETEFFETQGLVDTSKTLTRLEFLHHVLPTTGTYCVVSILKGKVIQIFPETLEAIDSWAEQQPVLGRDAYMSLGTFKDDERVAKNIVAYKAIWIDLDSGKSTAFPDQIEAILALRVFVDKVKLPALTVVSSGSGLHIYFTFTEDIDFDTWKPIASALKAVGAD